MGTRRLALLGPSGRDHPPAFESVRTALAPGHASDGLARSQGEGDPDAAPVDPAGRGPFPQPLADWRSGLAQRSGPRRGQVHDGSRTLAGLSLHVLWKFDQGVCEAAECVRCCVRAGRPPQFWRKTPLLDQSLRHLDALIGPSLSTISEHTRRGIGRPMTHLPYFLPEDYTGLPEVPSPMVDRPFFAVVGRLEKIKGFQDVIAAMPRLPHIDLRIAGSGPFEADLRRQAEGMANVHFEGRIDSAEVAALFRGALAVVVPSLVYETFGYVVLEAFAEKTPVIVRDLGALPELVAESGGGLVFRTQDELVASMQTLVEDVDLRVTLGCDGYFARHGIWSEAEHLERYFGLIEEKRRGRRIRVDRPHRVLASESGPRVLGLPVEVEVEIEEVSATPARLAIESSS